MYLDSTAGNVPRSASEGTEISGIIEQKQKINYRMVRQIPDCIFSYNMNAVYKCIADLSLFNVSLFFLLCLKRK